MHAIVREHHRDALILLCRRYYVSRLEVFGSAATDRFDVERSDVDLLVELDLSAPLGGLEQFFGFKHAAERLLGRRVDIVNPAFIRNSYFRQCVDETRELVYAADATNRSTPREGAPVGHPEHGGSDPVVHSRAQF